MVELSPVEEIIVKVMEELGATNDTAIRTADDITKKCGKPKGLVANSLQSLAQKGIIKRIAREKAAGYYLLKKQQPPS
ncbi:MAG: transcriptional regulator [Thermoplasmata archaeon]|jgi:predicted transcriptional regulator|nr:transcriptional regulator [Candidatus Sysuiplasma jiujiangense]MBX8639433.1 transcriptional regulator [Candidatus Sysuiplasma jiujiangense]MBX8641576.1 transcriptional regulator [Candidatus Sysuiplasma jiujiangense]